VFASFSARFVGSAAARRLFSPALRCIALESRARLSPVAPTLAASFGLGNAIVLLPIHVLGHTGTLTKSAVVATTLASISLAIAAASLALGRAGLGREVRALFDVPVTPLR
jgi:hypothetical protein